MIKHLLIDFDRTLNDSDSVYQKNLNGFLGLTGEEVLRNWEAIHRDILSKEPREKHEDLELHYKEFLDRFRAEDPVETKAALRRRIRAAQQECWDATALFDDAIPFLNQVKDAGYTLHIATGDYAQQKAEAVELQAQRSLFTRAFDESVLGVGKGKRDYFDRALALLGTSPSEVLVFGDSIPNDIGPALEAGIAAVWVRRQNEKPRRTNAKLNGKNANIIPTLTIPSLADGLASVCSASALPATATP